MNARIDLFVVADFFLGAFGWDDGDINKVETTVRGCLERTVG